MSASEVQCRRVLIAHERHARFDMLADVVARLGHDAVAQAGGRRRRGHDRARAPGGRPRRLRSCILSFDPGTPAAQAVPAPTVAVAGERASSAPTRLSIQEGCAARHARVTVEGSSMRRVRFSVKGRRARTVTVAPGARRITALVALRRGGPAVQKVTTRITFRNGAPARTLVTAARRCSPAVVIPKFTG